MKARYFMILQAVFLGLGLLVLTPSMNPMNTSASAGQNGNPLQANAGSDVNAQAVPDKAKHDASGELKPLAVWECTTSWYGEDFDGKQTANGETYDMNADTAAHPTLPLGSIVRVVNTRNHRSQVVRINDRGPYVEGRELDVSYEVARKLGFDQHGLAKVRLELLKVPPRQEQLHREN
jgi:rare lipoprotein A (peptidoglycan hydrolase)